MGRKSQPYFRIRNADKALELLKQWRYELQKPWTQILSLIKWLKLIYISGPFRQGKRISSYFGIIAVKTTTYSGT